MTRYEQPCSVHGDVLIGDQRIAVETPGERDHSWGVRDWWLLPWCWTAGRLDDGTTFHASKPLVEGISFEPGFVRPPDGPLAAIEGFSVATELGDEQLPVAASMQLGPLSMDVAPVAFAPLALVAPDGRVGRFPRAMCRFSVDDGRTGTGWTEWNQPPPP
jgi:hypothetical protein